MTDNDALAGQLLGAVRAQNFGNTADAWRGGQPVAQFPSIDLAVVQFRPDALPRWANVLFSRTQPHGLAANMRGIAGAVDNVRFHADQRNAQGDSVAWLPGADWSQLQWTGIDAAASAGAAQPPPRLPPLFPPSLPPSALQPSPPQPSPPHPTPPQPSAAQHSMVAPYPASLLKLMLAIGVGVAVDHGWCGWPAALEPMLVISDNAATDTVVALLHKHGVLSPTRSLLNQRFAGLGLGTLQLNDTTPQGGWRNADGAGVGHIHMTAWDTVRLLWLLDADAPPPPWLPAGHALLPLLQPATRNHLRRVLQRQQHDHVLSSGSLRGLPGWVQGLPDAPLFAHKTGSTDNYASDAGIVNDGSGGHYIVALLSNLGRRHAALAGNPHCVTTWRVPALGAAIHRLMTQRAD